MFASSRLKLFISIWCSLSGVGADIASDASCKKGNIVMPEEEFSLLQDKSHHARYRADEVDYVVTRDHVQTDAPGLAFRASADLEDRDPDNSLSLWGSIVRGTPIGMNWLKVGELYLPMRVGGHPVLERETYSDAATLAVTGQQPEDGDENDESEDAVAEDGAEDDATEPEATESELTESAASASEETEPEASEPATTEEIVTEPETTESESTETDATEEAASEDISTEPTATEAGAAEPEATETEPESTEPEAEEAIEDATEPDGTEPEVTEPEMTEPEATEMEQESSQSTDAVATEPVVTELDEAQPEQVPFNGVVVEFGVIFRSFPFLDFQSGTFTTSLALTQRWPNDASSHDAAAVGDNENPWSPNLVVTNHDIGGVEVISSSKTTNQTSGMVTQVDYLTIRVLQSFQLRNFPFDLQVLSVHVAPASPGAVSMKLVPIDFPGEPTLDPEFLKDQGFRLESVNEEETVVTAEDALLADPARGVVEVAVGRRASAYFSPIFLPAFLVLCVCWSTFFLPVPVAASFATPRTAVTAVAFVATLVLFLHIEQMVPTRSGRMWIDVFAEVVAILVFAAVVFNTLEQYVHSHMKRPILASVISRELQMFYPLLSACVLGLCFCVTRSKTLTILSAVCRFTLFAGILGYVGAAYARALIVDDGMPRGSVGDDGKRDGTPRASVTIRSDNHWRSPSPR